MVVLVTGAFGLVGRHAVAALISAGHRVRTLDLPVPANLRAAKRMKGIDRRYWGSLTDVSVVTEGCEGVDAVIHLAAIIPPAADSRPLSAYYVNVAGTEVLLQTLERHAVPPVLVFSSSISVYGDRVDSPYINLEDELKPGDHDYYGQQKVIAEGLIRRSSLFWSILRFSYVVSPEKLRMDPIMFDMPLNTSIEVVHVDDVAVALVHAAEGLQLGTVPPGSTFHIAGGKSCRTTYREYLKEMFIRFGIGDKPFPESAWGLGDFHCGFMETKMSESSLRYQSRSLKDYYDQVRSGYRLKAFLVSIIRPLVRSWILSRSPYINPRGGKKHLFNAERVTLLMKQALNRVLARGQGAVP